MLYSSLSVYVGGRGGGGGGGGFFVFFFVEVPPPPPPPKKQIGHANDSTPLVLKKVVSQLPLQLKVSVLT
jgi:hypothetical protein